MCLILAFINDANIKQERIAPVQIDQSSMAWLKTVQSRI